MKTFVLEPLGLLTQPNEYGQAPPGAMDRATNVHLRDPGVCSSLPGLQTLRSNALGASDVAKRVWAGDSYNLFFGLNGSTWTVKWVDASSATTITSPSAFSHTFSTGIIPVARQRSRTIVGTDNGPIVLDSETDSSARLAGFPVPYVDVYSIASGSTIPTGYHTAYIVIVRRLHSDGYEQFSPPSNQLLIANSTTFGDPTLIVTIASNSGIIAGDILEIYRTKQALIGTDPGDTYYLAISATVTAAQVTAGYAQVDDRTPNDDLGLEAYSNPGQENIDKRNRAKTAPPIARDICVHNGHTFYFGTTRPAKVQAYVAGTLSVTPADLAAGTDNRLYGLGYRGFTGDITNGSAIISNISAADIVGLDVGQRVGGTVVSLYFASADQYVTAVGATSITLGGNATGSQAGSSCHTLDWMTVDGYGRSVSEFALLASSIGLPYLANLYDSSISASASALVFQSGDSVAFGDAISGFEFAISRPSAYEGSFTIKASNGQNYQPPIATYSAGAQTQAVDQKLNRVEWALAEQPEAVPLLNNFYIGVGEIYRGFSVGGVILVFASDGLWQVNGDAVNGWTVNRRDPSLILASRGAAAVMDGQVWAYTNRGLVSVTPDGSVTEHSSGRIGEPQSSNEFAGANFSNTWATYLIAEQYHHDVWVTTTSGDSFFVLHTRTGKFTKYTPADDANGGDYSKTLNSVLLGTATSGGPSLQYFNADSSNTRHASAECRFLPLYDGDPSTIKEWSDVEYTLDGFSQSAGAITPSFDGTNFAARTVAQDATQSRVRVSVPRNAPAVAPQLRPGFTVTTGGTTNPWSLRAVAVTYRPAGEEGAQR